MKNQITRASSAIALGLMLTLSWAPAHLRGQAVEENPGPEPIGLHNVFKWKRISAGTLSNDGAWFAYRLAPGEGNGELVVRSTGDDKEHRFPIGERGGPISFSDDSRWLAFTISPTKEESERRGGRGQDAPRNKMGLLDLSSGDMTETEDIRSFRFSGESADWIALTPYGASGQGGGAASASGGRGGRPSAAAGEGGSDRPRSADLVLHELATGTRLNIGNVAEFQFDDTGRWLVWAVDAEGKVGNGILLRDMETGVIRVLESDEARYSRLAFNDDGALIAFKAVEDDDYEDPLYSIVAWTGFGATNGPTMIAYDPAQDESFPEGMGISSNRAPRWSMDQNAFFFGVAEVEMKEEAGEESEEEAAVEEEEEEEEAPTRADSDEVDDDEEPGLVIWHWKDPRLQRAQELQANRDRNFNYLSVYWIDSGQFVQLADEEVENVSPASVGHWAIGRDNTPYELMGSLDGRNHQDVYTVDMRTGEKEMILERHRWANDISPDGEHFLYYLDGHYYTYEFESGEHRNITASVPTSFIDVEDDHNVVDPPIRPMGWTEDGEDVLLYDDWDLWRVGVHGDEGTNLTVNGRADGIRYGQPQQFDPDDEAGFDLSDPVYFRTYGEWTKQAGFSLMTGGGPGAEVLAWDDVSYGGLIKADDADVYVVSWSTNEIYPNYHVTDALLRNPTQITDGFPEQEKYLWSAGSILVDYESDKGDRLQGALFLPADYQEGQSYPTIVYFYEKVSQGLNSYTFPSANGFNKSVYTSNGYAVFMPDIVYQINDPGMSAVWCVLPGLQAAIETGVVDSDRVGVHGHSWGGYQSSFLVTQTDAFAAVATGAPLTNMISMYGSIYWNSGSADGAIFESSQGRFFGGPWDHIEAYARNSPVYHAKNINTPILLLHNDQDGAVDWNQGVEFYNTVRRLQKPIVMLQYVGENHGVSREPNRKDYTVRMREFFDHYLKGEPAPKWWSDGVPHLEMDDHIKERIHLVRPPEDRERPRRGGGGD